MTSHHHQCGKPDLCYHIYFHSHEGGKNNSVLRNWNLCLGWVYNIRKCVSHSNESWELHTQKHSFWTFLFFCQKTRQDIRVLIFPENKNMSLTTPFYLTGATPLYRVLWPSVILKGWTAVTNIIGLQGHRPPPDNLWDTLYLLIFAFWLSVLFGPMML